ncbi:hypothetical protein [Winogradskyella sp.]|uniref:hypothetical protein n=1 Tax=Winogradskyella sp. TaxID=1883156 RepID=UPI002614AB28|nr:hypothetical protein [Winogradskyella sp.]
MKKLNVLFALLALIFTSCSLDEDSNQNFNFKVMPIVSVDMPDHFIHGETYAISISYIRPNSCYEFNDFAYEIDGNERIIAIVNTVYGDENSNCTGEAEEVTVDFDFTVTSTDTYIFKFFQGEDHTTGLDQYHIVEVLVSAGRFIDDKQKGY